MRGFRLLFFWVLFGLREDNQGSEGVEGANPKGMDETFLIKVCPQAEGPPRNKERVGPKAP